MAQSTSRRTREIGIRMALGATAIRIVQLVLSRGLRQLALGVVLGPAGALGTTRLMQKAGILIQVSPSDPIVFVSVIVLLVVIGVIACWLPARRAAYISPTEALRTE